jgi:transposase InsO family protein
LDVFKEFIVQNYGLPGSILTDRSQSFLGGVFASYLQENNVKHLKTSSYHPRTNGMTERLNRTLKSMLKKYCDGFPEKWDKCLNAAEFALRVRVHTVTGFSPFYLLYGRHPQLPGDDAPARLFDFDDEDERNEFTIRELEKLGQARAASYFRSVKQASKMVERQKKNQDVIQDVFLPGTYVKKRNYVKGSLDYAWNGPYIVTEVLPNSLYRLMKIDGTSMTPPVHQDDLRHYTGEKTTRYYHNNRMYETRAISDQDVQDNTETEEFQELEEESEIKEGGVVTLNPSSVLGLEVAGQGWDAQSEGSVSDTSEGSQYSSTTGDLVDA